MPIIVGCPNCAGQLRVADGLIGRKVRCPACNATFDTETPTAASPPPPPEPNPLPDLERPVVTERVDPWKALNLELTPDPPEPPPAHKPPPPEEDEVQRRPRRPRLNDDHDDLRPCPTCGRMVHRDSRRCVACGEHLLDDDLDDDLRPERRRGRDWEPHRAGFVLAMGLLSLAGPFVCPPLVFLGMVPGLMAWVMGSADLRKMRRGEMDPKGRDNTQAGWICGILGTLMSLLVVLGCGTLLGIALLAEARETKAPPRPRFNPPPIIVPANK